MRNDLILTVHNISHHFKNEEGAIIHALSNVSFSIERGKFVCIVGPSGCGKSTLLRIILGLEPQSRGTLDRSYRKPTMVFQNFALFPWLTVFDNIGFGLKMQGKKREEAEKIIEEKIEEVGLSGFEDKYPRELSGGMRQRVGIARALAVSPDILFMDEPFSSLDSMTARKLKDDLKIIWKKYSMTIVMVTHLLEEAVELADEIIIMSRRPGTIKSTRENNLAFPRNLRSPEFFSLLDQIDAQIDS
jgi:NitT/TauT family transport system ATP-binding protein